MYTNNKKGISKLFYLLFPVLLASVLLTSCMKDEESTSVASNASYVSSVSFNQLRRTATMKASDGVTDSTYYITYAATSWIFTIDHKTLSIENRDSLPLNTDLTRAVLKLSYGGATAYHRSSVAWAEDAWIPYNAEDSIDVSKPLHIKIVATDNTERIYTLRVNVHTQDGEALTWEAVTGNDAFGGAYPMKAVAINGKVAVLVNDGTAVAWMEHELNAQGEWERYLTDLPQDADVRSLAKGQERVFVNTASGGLFASYNGYEWEELYHHEGLRLVGVSNDKLYATFGNALNSIYVGASEWKTEDLDEEYSLLPSIDQEQASITYAQNKDLTRMIVVGNRNVETDTTAVVWSKCWMDFEDEDKEGWMHYTRNWDNTHQLPMLTHLNLMYYDNMLLMAGGKSKDGKIPSLERFYMSQDNGLTWWRQHAYMPPAEQRGAEGYIAATVDQNNFIWLMAKGKVFRGRINRLGFERQDVN